ncbi:MAG: alpha/beta hydrolase [Nocardioides sp.]|nr:alpha/beta hydrolase [Nocardioides sp.]
MPRLQPSLTHQLLAWAVPRVRGSRELDTPEQERARIERGRAGRQAALPTSAVPGFVRRFDVDTQIEDGLTAYVVTPVGTNPDRTVVYVHGGGFVAPIDAFHVRYAARLAAGLGVRVVLPDYPLAPEHTWRDSHDPLVALTTGWLARSPGGVVLAGDSAGGGLALAVALSLRDRGGPQPTHLLLHAPWVDLTTSTPETAVVTDYDPWLFLGKLRAYAGWWAGAPADLFRPEVSPALADLSDLPPALVFCGSRDTLVPGCRLLRDRAAEAGWPLTYVEAPGLIHVFPLLPLIPEARRAWRLTREFLTR